MKIGSFSVLDSTGKIALHLTEATAATTLLMWTHKTYKTEGLEVDLSSKLNGADVQNIYITTSDLGVQEFDGIYFVEVKSDTETVSGIAEELTRYKECILEKVRASKDCESCYEINDKDTFNSHVLLTSLEMAVKVKHVQEILYLAYGLDKLCTNECKGCGKYKKV